MCNSVTRSTSVYSADKLQCAYLLNELYNTFLTASVSVCNSVTRSTSVRTASTCWVYLMTCAGGLRKRTLINRQRRRRCPVCLHYQALHRWPSVRHFWCCPSRLFHAAHCVFHPSVDKAKGKKRPFLFPLIYYPSVQISKVIFNVWLRVVCCKEAIKVGGWFNPFKPSGVKWLHFRVLMTILI